MFTLTKIAAFFAQPSSLAALTLIVGVLLMQSGRRPRLARRLVWGAIGYLVIAGLLPAGNAILLPLEQRFAGQAKPEPRDGYKGIIILGGFEDGWVSAGRGLLAVNESAERLTEGLRLALRLPETKVLFTGGVGGLWPGGKDATEAVRDFLATAGVDPGRILLEGASRNTIENAAMSAELIKPEPGERWLLVTSAYHMPRAVGLFRKAGFDVTGYPVDFRTRDAGDLMRPFERIPQGLQRMDLACNEWLGLWVAWLAGETGSHLPSPKHGAVPSEVAPPSRLKASWHRPSA